MGALSEHEDEWGRRATAAAIAAARKIVCGDEAAINPNIPVGQLNEIMWGWIVAAVIFAWIATRAQQAVEEGRDVEVVIRSAMLDPNPWDAGSVATILPQLADMPGADWSKPLAEWSRDNMVAFLTAALGLIRTAIRARDLGGVAITRKPSLDELVGDTIPF
jgi:hypothetical protein